MRFEERIATTSTPAKNLYRPYKPALTARPILMQHFQRVPPGINPGGI